MRGVKAETPRPRHLSTQAGVASGSGAGGASAPTAKERVSGRRLGARGGHSTGHYALHTAHTTAERGALMRRQGSAACRYVWLSPGLSRTYYYYFYSRPHEDTR